MDAALDDEFWGDFDDARRELGREWDGELGEGGDAYLGFKGGGGDGDWPI
jgi:hypothetical protein